ncbi:hypothetical protein NYO99_08235 [Pelomonas sp. UHG3]|uniref:Uncharacterized protein n=1 Tax=Roseateles hydrophilus TaxID=2975054 RepID=A0ACC6C968_9BURK|nr:hypothetical protein [Pelomonas sp. UHG3]MCY4744956.1 hypothetical protein [Pelomonas sp. UHG3]
MARKSKKSSSSNCGRNAAKKNNSAQLEWGKVVGGALRGIQSLASWYRLIEVLKTFLDQSDLFG